MYHFSINIIVLYKLCLSSAIPLMNKVPGGLHPPPGPWVHIERVNAIPISFSVSVRVASVWVQIISKRGGSRRIRSGRTRILWHFLMQVIALRKPSVIAYILYVYLAVLCMVNNKTTSSTKTNTISPAISLCKPGLSSNTTPILPKKNEFIFLFTFLSFSK